MAPSTTVAPNKRLADCPLWPTSHTLPREVTAHLEWWMWRLRGTGRSARVQDVLGLTILFFAPEDAVSLIRLMNRPHVALRGTVAELPTGRHRRGLSPHSEQLMMWLPSPVTLRLNLLIEVVHDRKVRTTRRQMVSALVLHAIPTSLPRVCEAYDRFPDVQARQAAVAGLPTGRVLSLSKPKPGRRPMG